MFAASRNKVAAAGRDEEDHVPLLAAASGAGADEEKLNLRVGSTTGTSSNAAAGRGGEGDVESSGTSGQSLTRAERVVQPRRRSSVVGDKNKANYIEQDIMRDHVDSGKKSLDGEEEDSDDSEAGDEDDEDDNVETNDPPPVSFWGTVANQILAALGAGILSLPLNAAAAGIVNTLIFTSAMLWLNYVSVMILVRASEKYQIFDMEKLMRQLTGGRIWFWLCTSVLRVSFTLCLIAYMITFRDSLLKLLDRFVPSEQNAAASQSTMERLAEMKRAQVEAQVESLPSYTDALLSRQIAQLQTTNRSSFWTGGEEGKGVEIGSVWLISLGTLLVTPLCFFPTQWLSYTSYFSIAVNVFVLIIIFVNFALQMSNLPGHSVNFWYASQDVCHLLVHLASLYVCLLGFTSGNFGLLSSLVMAMSVQPCMPPMYQEMKDRSVESFALSMKISTGFLFFLFSLFSVFAILTYGDELEGNVLNNLPGNAWYTTVVQVGMALVVLCVFPLIAYPMKVGFESAWWRLAWTVGPILIAFGGAILCTFLEWELDFLNNVSGAISAFFFLAFFPAVVGSELNEGFAFWKTCSLPAFKYWVFAAFGLAAMVLGLIWPEGELKFRAWQPSEPRATSYSSGPYLEMEGEADSSRLQLSKIILDQRGVHKNLVEATASTAAASGRTAQAPQQASLLAKPDLLVDFGNEYYDGRQDDVLPKFQEFTKKIVRTVGWTWRQVSLDPADRRLVDRDSAYESFHHARDGENPPGKYKAGIATKDGGQTGVIDTITYAYLVERILDNALQLPFPEPKDRAPTSDAELSQLTKSIEEKFKKVSGDVEACGRLEGGELTLKDMYAVFRRETKGRCQDKCLWRSDTEQPEFK